MAADVGPVERKVAKLSKTIFALSSGTPPAAIAVIRISGPDSDSALEALAGKLPEPRHATLSELCENGEVLDRALILRFKAPRSATGEDSAELHLHGGRAVVARVLAALSRLPGLRPAKPGEFTRRAFEEGRIDLAEAEGLADLLQAETESQRRNAQLLAGGALSRQVAEWQDQLLSLAATVEASLDFADEDDVGPLGEAFSTRLEALRDEINAWLDRPSADRLRDGFRVVIAGPPNTGKSTLLNALVGRDAAITAPQPGTTRDIIEAPVAIAGRPFLMVDTAGIRSSSDEIEAIGVERGQAAARNADLLLWLGAPEDAPSGAIRIHSKSDLGPPTGPVDLAVSPRTGHNVDTLVRLLLDRAAALLPKETEVALHARHRGVLAQVADGLDEARNDDPILAAEALRLCRLSLDQLTGRAGVEHMLDMLFGRFCIGK